LGTTGFGPAIGARASIQIINETKYGRLRTGVAYNAILADSEIAIPFLNESIGRTINELVSGTLNPARGIVDTIRGTSDVAGDINFELRPQGYGQLIKAAMCDGGNGGTNYVKVQHARGDVGVQVLDYKAAVAAPWSVKVKCTRTLIEEWAALWTIAPLVEVDFVHVRRNPTTGLMVANAEKFKTIDGGVALLGTAGDPHQWHTLDQPALGSALAADVWENSWIFPIDGSKFANAYLHYLELGAEIPMGLNVDIMRDIALFVYTGMRPNTWTMNFNAGEIVNGTLGFVGKEEFIGGELTTAVTNAAGGGTTLAVDDLRIFNNWPGIITAGQGEVMVGGETDIKYHGNGGLGTLYVALDTDVAMETPYAGSMVTELVAFGGVVNAGTDMVGAGPWPGPWPAGYGYFVGQPVCPTIHRSNTGVIPLDIQATMLDLTSYTYFEAHAEFSSGLVNTISSDPLGLEIAEILSANFTVDNGIYTDKYVLGKKYREKAPVQQRNVTGTITIEFDDMRQYRKFVDGRAFSFMVRCISEDADNGFITVDCPYSTCFYFHKVKYTGDTPKVNDSGIITVDMPFRSLVDNGDMTNHLKAFSELAVWMTNKRSVDLWS
jgi:hypothetical protein